MYYSAIGLIAIMIHLILNHEYFRNKEEKNEVNKIFKQYLWVVLVYFISDTFWGIIYETRIAPLIYADTVIYYITMALTVVIVCRYVTTYLNIRSGAGLLINLLGSAFAVVELTLLVINHFRHIFFWIEPDGSYHAYAIRYLALYTQILLCIMLAVQTGVVAYRTVGSVRRRYFAIFIFCDVMTSAIIIQLGYPLLPIYTVGLVMGICIIHIFIKEDEKEESKIILEKKNRELASVNEEQYAQLEEISSLNEMLRVQQETKNELYTAMESFAEIFYSIHEIDLVNDTVDEFSAKNEVKEIVSHKKGAVETMRQVMSTVITDEYLEEALAFTDLTTLSDRMRNKKVISKEIVGKHTGWFIAMFCTMKNDDSGRPTKVLYTTRVIDEEKKEAEKLIKKTQTDELTGLLNRRAYEEDIYAHDDIPEREEFVYVSLDVNGLKVVNDTIGHVAGDELIIGACSCMKKAFGEYGKIYRTGGDEFVAIVYVSDEKIKELTEEFEKTMSGWSGELVDSLTVSYGYVSKHEYPEASTRALALIAEKRMYDTKTAHYRKQGLDRRGQHDAHKALCELYTKILRINLTDDSYQIVNMDASERATEKGFAENLSEWLSRFAKSGQVHPDDMEGYLRMTDLQFLKKHFADRRAPLQIFYRRKYEDGFKMAMMEIIAADDYSDENQSLFLYVRDGSFVTRSVPL